MRSYHLSKHIKTLTCSKKWGWNTKLWNRNRRTSWGFNFQPTWKRILSLGMWWKCKNMFEPPPTKTTGAHKSGSSDKPWVRGWVGFGPWGLWGLFVHLFVRSCTNNADYVNFTLENSKKNLQGGNFHSSFCVCSHAEISTSAIVQFMTHLPLPWLVAAPAWSVFAVVMNLGFSV